MKSNSAMSTKVTSVLMATMALLGHYAMGTAPSTAFPSPDVNAPRELRQESDALASVIRSLISGMNLVESEYARIVKKLLSGASIQLLQQHPNPEDLAQMAAVLASIRGVELALKNTAAPAELASLHLELRKATANARSRMEQVHSLHRQAITIPDVVDGLADTDALKVLAKHSTAQLVAMADA